MKPSTRAGQKRKGRYLPQRVPVAGLLAVCLACALITVAQNTGAQDPLLHKRSPGSPDTASSLTTASGRSDLPPEAEGRYRWNRGGRGFAEIEVYFEGGKLQGYLLEHTDPDPHASPAVFAFAVTHADGSAVSWTTRQVHGTSYSFDGHLERGKLPGSYLMTGILTEHGGDADGLQSTVSLKREPGVL